MPTTPTCPPPLPEHLAAVPRDWLSPQELADWLGIPVKTIYTWNAHSTGPRPTKIGKHCRYARQSVAAWLAAQETAADREAS